jgi:RHS repeat-associated protein
MGNVMYLLNASGTGAEKYKYDAFGAPKITDWTGNARTSSACGNRFMFSGRDYLDSLGLYDLRNRVYDPSMGHFYQTDPLGFASDPANLYRFSGNNPLLGGDPTGLGTVFWSKGSEWGWYVNSSDSPNTSSDYTSEVGVYNGASYAYVGGYSYSSADEAFMTAIFGPPASTGITSWESDLSSFVSGGPPVFSGTAFFGSVLSPGKLSPINSQITNSGDGKAANVSSIIAIGAGAGEYLHHGPGYWRGADQHFHSIDWGGNGLRAAGRRATALKIAKAFRVVGVGTFVWDAFTEGPIMLHDPTEVNRDMAGIRLGLSSVGTFGGIPGFLVATEFTVIDETMGLDKYFEMMDKRTEEGFWFQPGP